MATGRSTQLTRQIGEHLVASELGRMGFLATPFAGNVPSFDLLVANEAGVAIPVQVKTINGPSWQFNASAFLDIEFHEDVQKVMGRRATPNPNLVCVFVLLRGAGKDEFFTLTFKKLQDHFFEKYKGRKRPRNPKSTHCAVWPKELQRFKNWDALLLALKPGAVRPNSETRPTLRKRAAA